jgi:membrane associated rhomboid family serine protease
MRRGTDFASLAPVTTLFMMVNIVVYIVEAIHSNNLNNIDTRVLMALGASWREGLWDGEWHRLIAANFLHVHLLHIILNSISLKALGPMTEIHFGSSNFGTLYILSGVCGFCVSQIFGAHLSAGASASIFGIIGAILAARIVDVPVLKYAWRNSDVRQSALWAAIYLFIGIAGLMGLVNNWAHLGGFISGLLLGGFFELWRKHQRMSIAAIASVFLLLGALIGGARWSVFSPYYHIHQGLLAEQDSGILAAEPHFAEAVEWAKRWGKEQSVRRLINQHKLGLWSVQDARDVGYERLPHVVRARSDENATRLEETGSSEGAVPPAEPAPENAEPKTDPKE